ncbi:unnamed protein product [Ceutorhynchus assimilis]|uniref:Uncharacterized protein n=1 Tax=Ceutorhynchus assimilis TaxID=467358 RepID=A0A9N9MVG1_9CUCU|nr:unnamed protein product [Ceutorhynchus assimilis]
MCFLYFSKIFSNFQYNFNSLEKVESFTEIILSSVTAINNKIFNYQKLTSATWPSVNYGQGTKQPHEARRSEARRPLRKRQTNVYVLIFFF